ncbi:MAG: spermidine synthase [Campylobacterota bacterium]|nr:spermidine synthase [Campylobacterota bacterium]
MSNFSHDEMMIHVPMCTHKKPENILVISDNLENLQTELVRYKGVDVKAVNTSEALEVLRNEAEAAYDIVIFEENTDAAILAHISRVLKEDGLVALCHPDLDDVEANKSVMQVLGNYFKIIMPYNAAQGTVLLASKEYHPTADIILQRSDLLEGHKYYNCDMHIAAFAMPNNIRKNYLGVIRN